MFQKSTKFRARRAHSSLCWLLNAAFRKDPNLTTLEAQQALLIAIPKRNCDVIENTGGQGQLLHRAAVSNRRQFKAKESILPLDNTDCTVVLLYLRTAYTVQQ